MRRAFALAIDRNFLADRLLHGMVKPLSGPFPPGALFYTPLPAPHDIAEANRLLDEAGYPRGKDGKRFSIIVDYSPDTPLPRELLRLLQYELAALPVSYTHLDVYKRQIQNNVPSTFSEKRLEMDMPAPSPSSIGDPVPVNVGRVYG